MIDSQPGLTPQNHDENSLGIRGNSFSLRTTTFFLTTLLLIGAAGAQTGEKAERTPREPKPPSDTVPGGSDEQMGSPEALAIAESARLAMELDAASGSGPDPDPDPNIDLSPSEQFKTMTAEVIELQQELAGLDAESERAAEIETKVAENLEVMEGMAFNAAVDTGTALMKAGEGMRDTNRDMEDYVYILLELEDPDDFFKQLASRATNYPGVDSDMMALIGKVPDTDIDDFVESSETLGHVFRVALQSIPKFQPSGLCQE